MKIIKYISLVATMTIVPSAIGLTINNSIQHSIRVEDSPNIRTAQTNLSKATPLQLQVSTITSETDTSTTTRTTHTTTTHTVTTTHSTTTRIIQGKNVWISYVVGAIITMDIIVAVLYFIVRRRRKYNSN